MDVVSPNVPWGKEDRPHPIQVFLLLMSHLRTDWDGEGAVMSPETTTSSPGQLVCQNDAACEVPFPHCGALHCHTVSYLSTHIPVSAPKYRNSYCSKNDGSLSSLKIRPLCLLLMQKAACSLVRQIGFLLKLHS